MMTTILMKTYVQAQTWLQTWAQKTVQKAAVQTTALDKEDEGMATAEYAIVLVAATSFAGLLVVLLKSDAVRNLLTKLITDALSVVA
ncbi:hypothetical protein B9G54_04700 [Alloscardovia macacae]|uniref:DUF4244 domain-containing protein n=1 Tax=Alloscardovia macacae TaxID=1160091 RepID=A0A1Y2SZT3_9BIFI|nr:DUF4244 domain-containing protein [Alloscardovia macacae]OTA26493.1 hypothetical protein B9G54_04700 [Alloscardovia macacae]OTA29829.1 hypothetical protein B9T39_01750 [Alloscardovia macacae]